jgi:hypothetical protein
MRALDASTEVRYKDCEEAETALRQAWELCLHSGIILPQSLTGSEVAHEKAPKAFHSAVSTSSPGVHDTQTKDAPLVIESKKRKTDAEDDPTSVYNPDRTPSGQRKKTPSGLRKLGVGSTQVEEIELQAKRTVARTNRATPPVEVMAATEPGTSGGGAVWFLLLLLVVGGGVLVAYFLLGT